MLLGYARVSTADQNPDHQIDALARAGVTPDDIHLDRVSGAKSSRPQLDLVLRRLRNGDTLVITRLDRLGRSVLHLVALGAQLRERGVGLKVLEQGIDTATAEGRAMFGMLSVLAELQRELIVANTRDGLAAARARGRTGGRRPKLTPAQAATAQRLYDEGQHTVAQIADILKVKRSTLYGHLDKASVGGRPRAAKPRSTATTGESSAGASDRRAASSSAATVDEVARSVSARTASPEPATQARRDPDGLARSVWPQPTPTAASCPTCRHQPASGRDRCQQRQDLATTWLYPDPERPDQLLERRHCRECQPHQQISIVVECLLCGDGPFLTGELADHKDARHLPGPVTRWLTDAGWRIDPDLICPQHDR
jgi:DNA invertase Pin-like site-specific DNA recombinase